MTRQRETRTIVTCDSCGNVDDAAAEHILTWNKDRWAIDLCASCAATHRATFDTIVQHAHPARRRGPSRPTPAEREERWEILEQHGFTRHPGRLSAAELAALAQAEAGVAA